MASRIDVMLANARSQLSRLQPHGVTAALKRGALLVDIRPERQRQHEGQVPGALVIYFVRNYIAKGFALGRV